MNKVEFYGTLLKRFEEYLIALLVEHYAVNHEENFEVSKTKDKMMLYQVRFTKCKYIAMIFQY